MTLINIRIPLTEYNTKKFNIPTEVIFITSPIYLSELYKKNNSNKLQIPK